MSGGEERKGEHVVYGDAGGARARKDDEKRRREVAADVEAAGRGSLGQALLPLLIGFALLVGLVIGLGVLSGRELEKVRFSTEQEERKLSETLRRLLNLQLALSKLDREARIRAQVEAGTKGVLLPPSDLRLRNERGAVEKSLSEYDALPLKDEARKARVRAQIVAYVETTKDMGAFSAQGFPAYRDLEAEMRGLIDEASEQREDLTRERDEALEYAQGRIQFLQFLAALTGLVVAAATTLEVMRRFRQMRRGYDALRQARQFSTQMLEGMVSAIAAIDREDRIRSANAAFFEVFPNARPGLSIHDDFTTADGMKLLAAATSARVERATYRGRWKMGHDAKGRERAFDVYSSPLEIEGEPGQLLTLVDVTEAAESEQVLRRQEALAAVGQSAAQIAHEIKNPLGSIRLGVAMLRDTVRDRESLTTIDLVERGIEHLSKLTLDVTQFSRSKRLTLTDVDLHALLDGSLELVFDRLEEMQTPVERRYAAAPLRGHWDDDQLRQVFVNLFTNAVDAGGTGSPVTLTTEAVTAEAPRGRNGERSGPKPFARVTIADRGAGMDEQTRARIFEPFFTTKRKGTGLGLAIAKQIVEQHGGRIHVASRPGEGTRFTVELPLPPNGATQTA